MEKLKNLQDCPASCWAVPAVKSALSTIENVTGGSSIALSLFNLLNPLADGLAIVSYCTHITNSVVDQSKRPKTKIDWVVEILLLLLFILSVASLLCWMIPCGFTVPIMVTKIATILSFTLFSATWQLKLPW